MLAFLLGCAMGVGKAAVFKHIPEYLPDRRMRPWMHWTAMKVLHRESPELAGRIEHPSGLPSLVGRRHRRTDRPVATPDLAEPEEARA